MSYQERYLLSLDDSRVAETIQKLLKSPIKLSKEVIRLLFEKDFDLLVERLDSIKEFVAGVTRAKRLKDYSLARLYPNLFSFHQYFQSSYRARQGNVLEELIKEILRGCDPKFKVPDKNLDKVTLVSSVFKKYKAELDIDVGAQKPSKEVLVLQLRSRDDTGGTTAKASLVEVLREALRFRKVPGTKLLYLVGIWDEVKGSQKSATIRKIYSSLRGLIPKKIDEPTFAKDIVSGVTFKKGVELRLAYGVDEITHNLSVWAGPKYKLSPKTIKGLVSRIENWDDLWLAYSIASIELENFRLLGKDNIDYLDSLLKNIGFDVVSLKGLPHKAIIKQVNDAASKIIPLWKEDSIKIGNIADRVHYIRDLILLKAIYEIS